MRKKLFVASVVVAFVYLTIGIWALPEYSINWDESVHFTRGQAILHYILTGKKDYGDFAIRPPTRRSNYQLDYQSYAFFEDKFDSKAGAGHPTVSDILSAVSNRVFYGKLGVIGDIEGYHLYSLALAAILAGVVCYFIASHFGVLAGLVSALALSLYPAFLGEARYNIKDVPEAVFYSFTILSFYQGIVSRKIRWIIVSSFFFGLAFGTKLNVVFALPTLALWVVVVWYRELKREGMNTFIYRRKAILLAMLAYPVLPIMLYFGSWPILWKDPIGRFIDNMNYYRTIGLAGEKLSDYTTIGGISTLATQWVLYITPIVTLVFFSSGIMYWIFTGKREKQYTTTLVVLWLAVPIIRVSLSGTAMYGGVRQIMEYIPAMAMLAGIGAQFLTHRFKRHTALLKLIIFVAFVPVAIKMYQMHPNESVYFNPLIGGLRGAAEKNIPGWGNTLGSTYRQATRWLNAHAEPDARLATVYGLKSDIPSMDLRPDIAFLNSFRSMTKREGEYIIGMTHYGTYAYMYHRKYLDRFLIPIFVVEEEGVPLMKIWKNDKEHLKPELRGRKEITQTIRAQTKDTYLDVDVGRVVELMGIRFTYPTAACTLPDQGYFMDSIDGQQWQRESGDFSGIPLTTWFRTKPEPGVLQFVFAAEPARFIRVVTSDTDSCFLTKPVEARVSYLE